MNQALGNIVANAFATGAGAVVGGESGAFSGYNVDRFNRQLHFEENEVVKKLANGDPNKEHRLEAAGCVLVNCAAEYPPGTADYEKYSALENEGARYAVEQDQLKNYTGIFFSAATAGGMVKQTSGSGLFNYSSGDVQKDGNAFMSSVLARQPGKIDYIIVGGSAFGGAASIGINLHNGNIYLGGGGSVPVGVGASITFGLIPSGMNKSPTIQAEKADDFLGGGAFGGSICAFGGCLGGNHAMGGDTSVEFGVGFGGFTRPINLGGSGSTGFSFPVGTLPGMQPKRN